MTCALLPDGDAQDYLTAFKGSLYFKATENKNGAELWQSDGTKPSSAPSQAPTSSPTNAPTIPTDKFCCTSKRTLLFGINNRPCDSTC